MPRVDKDLVRYRIIAAKRRSSDLLALGPKISSLAQERQQLMEEFFFHAVASIEMAAQVVNEGRALGKLTEMVTPWSIARALPPGDPIRSLLQGLYANPKRDPRPVNLYSSAGLVWRLWNYRHQVSHRGRTALVFRVSLGAPSSEPPISLLLDPTDASAGHSVKSLHEELEDMNELVETRCETILLHLPD